MLLSTSSCSVSVRPGYVEDDKRTAELAIGQFHERFNTEHYQEIYDDAHDIFKKGQRQDDAIKAMEQTRDRFGKIEQVTDKWINVIIGAPVQIRAVYNTKFSKSDTTEMFIFVKERDAVKLVQYQIHPGTQKVEADLGSSS
jgi:hypothetical protein